MAMLRTSSSKLVFISDRIDQPTTFRENRSMIKPDITSLLCPDIARQLEQALPLHCFLVCVLNNLKERRLRFTMQQKLAILGEIHLTRLENTLRKCHLTDEVLDRWQRKFKGTKSGNFVHPIEGVGAKNTAEKPMPAKPVNNEKEDAFLRLVASLIVKCVLEKNTLNR
jgi:hypothetical protein